MFVYEPRDNDIEAVVCIRKSLAGFEYLRVMKIWISHNRFIDVAPLDMRTPVPKIEQLPSILDVIVDDVFSASGTKVEHSVR
ncbi:hypothetical protein MCHUDSM44219_00716 [Mycolicibacterium chubuense]|uniref:Uncharacterized protein n=1 Tax=Mycolicibacterium chubuense TaxID=1800 RepID=A0A0J6WPC0_MYCCU|nr:hypothetical protein MCHUDSM44219_00716 [Mycolicibacterium chubuense]SPY00401.1 Uncharacterised protein [Mycolicibacterium chubuense]